MTNNPCDDRQRVICHSLRKMVGTSFPSLLKESSTLIFHLFWQTIQIKQIIIKNRRHLIGEVTSVWFWD